ncbi:hypothetical protein ABG067_007147 [Albugo candida]|uniref:J domain-containing protein n=1 Tax=Albugo candida TaxID=65357 RepID=A0A024FWD4_9STRA|nr:unnamed protein product [Albugo candida]|eukprot:CCI11232.1 unnamed protein product [Albugo candida]
MDYYEILCISRSATENDIKKAYRKLAMRWHPDKNRGNAIEAQEKFQKISEAYDVLIDPQRRATFDQFGYEGLKNGVPDDNGNMTNGYAFSGKDSEQIFHNFFGTSNPFYHFGFNETLPFASGMKKNGAEQAKPIEHDLQCTLEELCYGDVKRVPIQRKRLLDDELVDENKTFEIKIKPGWKEGTKITFEGEGNESRQHESGNVVFRIAEAKHDLFSRDGANLVFTTKIKLAEALGDHCVYVPTIDGRKLAISCNEVIYPSLEKTLKGEGMPISNSPGTRGDLILKFDIIFPKHLTKLQKQSLAKILA